jgi:hypothetical protein
VAALAERVAALIPPAFVRQMGERAQQLAGGLDSAAAGMEGGDGVPAARHPWPRCCRASRRWWPRCAG